MPAALILGLSPYVWITIIFLIVLLIVLFVGDFGGDFDTDVDTNVAHGISPLSLPVLALFGTSFGAVAAIVDTLDLPTVAVVTSAGLVAAVVAGGMYFAMSRFLVKAQISSDVTLQNLVGMQGNVTIPVTPGSTGQVLVITAERGRTLLSAIASEEIRNDEAVVIDGVVGNSVRVRRVN